MSPTGLMELQSAPLRVSLINGGNVVDPFRILMCGYGRILCERGNYCRRCALDRIDFAWSEFLPAWPRAPFWYAMVLAMDQRASHAGIHLGVDSLDPEADSVPIYQPFQTHADSPFVLPSGPEMQHIIDGFRNAFFDTAEEACKKGIISGAFAHFELSFSFWRGPSNYDLWSGIKHRIEPHLNVLINSSTPLEPAICELYQVFINRLIARLTKELLVSYPDMWFSRISDEEGMRKWLAYMLKSWRVDKWYRDGLRRGCDRRSLNLMYDEIVFENGYYHSQPKNATRRYGNLRYNAKRPQSCIAFPIPGKPSSSEVRMLQNEAFAQTHPELEKAADFWREKRAKRRGSRRNQDIEIDY
jgi:hypothetical protein